jgi:hypothetical protein
LVTRMVLKESAGCADRGVGVLEKIFRFYLRSEFMALSPCVCYSTSGDWLR